MKCTIHIQYWAANRSMDKETFEDPQIAMQAAEVYLAADYVSGIQLTIEKDGAR
jgi:hypothetical protein